MNQSLNRSKLDIEISEILESIISFRKEIHRYPELGYKEEKTTKRIVEFLENQGLEMETFNDLTGAFTNIRNGHKKTIGIRVDIDALPITENTGLSYSSEHPGIMHACGHDVHTSIGVGIAILMNRMKEFLKVNVKIVFQPAEECNPNGGAKELIRRGILENPSVDEMYGFHVWPRLSVGEIAVKKGPIMASSDKLSIIVRGKKTHAAEPHKGVDAISIGMDIINTLEFKLKREMDPFDPYVISIGKFNSRGRYNIICDYAEIEGTVRTFNENTRKKIHKRVLEIANGIAKSYGGEADAIINRGYDTVINDEKITENFIDYAKKTMGKGNVRTEINASLIGEDFSFFSKKVPSLYFHLGCDCEYPLHSDKFFAKEETIEIGLRLIAGFILSID